MLYTIAMFMITVVYDSDDFDDVTDWVLDALALDDRADRHVNIHRIEPVLSE